nr:hypothetical protein [Rhodococcus wratislaviensis]GLK38048.1 hypothetical protein GCM10017611_49130 [Rhodococcus wratislaviensis]
MTNTTLTTKFTEAFGLEFAGVAQGHIEDILTAGDLVRRIGTQAHTELSRAQTLFRQFVLPSSAKT